MRFKKLKLQLQSLIEKKVGLEKELEGMRDVSDEIHKWVDLVHHTQSCNIKYKGFNDEIIEADMSPTVRALGHVIINKYEIYNNYKRAVEKELKKTNEQITGVELELFLHPRSVIQRKLYDLGISSKFYAY